MDPFSIAFGLVALLKQLIPAIQDQLDKGEVSDPRAQELLDSIKSLETRAGGEFTGTHWDNSGRKDT